MRPKVVIFALLLVLGVVLAGLLLGGLTNPSRPPLQNRLVIAASQPGTEAPEGTDAAQGRSASKPEQESVTAPAIVGSAGDASMTESAEDQHQAYVQTRTAELMDLAVNDDRDSLNIIISEFNNRDPEIRKAAVQAAVQFDSPDAIPGLMDAATQTDDPHEKASIADAIEFLKIPALPEIPERKNNAPNAPAADAAGTNPGQ